VNQLYSFFRLTVEKVVWQLLKYRHNVRGQGSVTAKVLWDRAAYLPGDLVIYDSGSAV
jgi:hypothetical protein